MATAEASATPDYDDALVARVAAGDAIACRELADRHLARTFRFAYRLLGNEADAEDVAQEAFVRLWEHAGQWRSDGARLSTWLYRVTLNLCRDGRARAREQPLESAPEPADPEPSALEQLHERDLASRVNLELAGLTERQRTAIVLCHYDGLTNVEAAEVMSVTVEALESLLARGRRTLRARLSSVAAALIGDE